MSTINPNPATPPFITYWQNIWLRPRQTMIDIYQGPRHGLLWLPAIIAGVASMFDVAIAGQFWKQLPLAQVWMAALMLGPLVGMLHVGVLGFFVRQFGKLLKGFGDTQRIRLALCWASVPVATALIPAALEYYLRSSQGESVLTSALMYLRTGLGLWGVLLMCMCVSEAQQFSFKHGALNVLSVFAAFILLLLLLAPQ